MNNRPICFLHSFLTLLLFFSFAAHAAAQSSSRNSAARQPVSNEQSESKPVGFALVELFTSEGCSSCPPADRLLAEIDRKAQESNLPVYVISMHVDYWNRLGWLDPFSTEQFTDRQRRYAALLGGSQVYTPQMIVNGTQRFVGSRAKEASQALSKALATPAKASLSIKVIGNQLSYETHGVPKGAVLNVAFVQPFVTQAVPRGENANRQLEHTNVARLLETYPLRSASAKSASATVKFDRSRIGAEATKLIAYVQVVETGEILAAASISLSR